MKLPGSIKPRKIIKALQRAGFKERFTKGSHIVLTHQDGRRTIVSFHPKPLSRGEVKTILRQTKITPEEFFKLL